MNQYQLQLNQGPINSEGSQKWNKSEFPAHENLTQLEDSKEQSSVEDTIERSNNNKERNQNFDISVANLQENPNPTLPDDDY